MSFALCKALCCSHDVLFWKLFSFKGFAEPLNLDFDVTDYEGKEM